MGNAESWIRFDWVRGLLGKVSKAYNQVHHSFSSRILEIDEITVDEKESMKEEEEEEQKKIFKKGFCAQRNHCTTIRLTYYCPEAIHSCSTLDNNSKPQNHNTKQNYSPKIQTTRPNRRPQLLCQLYVTIVSCAALLRLFSAVVVQMSSSRGTRARQVRDNGRPFIGIETHLPQ